MADETMFVRLVAMVIASHTRMPPSNYIELDGTTRRYVTVDADLIVRALLAELRGHGMSDDVMAKLASDAVDVGDAKTIWADTIDAILAESESGGASAQPGAG